MLFVAPANIMPLQYPNSSIVSDVGIPFESWLHFTPIAVSDLKIPLPLVPAKTVRPITDIAMTSASEKSGEKLMLFHVFPAS
jgi:hypothetical protein